MRALIVGLTLLLVGCAPVGIVNTFSVKESVTVIKWDPVNRFISFVSDSGLVVTNVYIWGACEGCYSIIGDKMDITITQQVKSNNTTELVVDSNEVGKQMRKF
ncbi:hypothetical protein [Aeromonas phage AS-yj]|uniref:Lipoprotein n=2 Tax=Ceceduovirus aszj TaxID=2843652 RepID=A0A291LE32_9CAUD|nr:hypothetical protein [Aeromonas phage AS-szw]ATI17802.1 hypothetical protein [Aeromonas phage AS-yj]